MEATGMLHTTRPTGGRVRARRVVPGTPAAVVGAGVLLCASCAGGADESARASASAAALAAGLPAADAVVARSGSWAPAPEHAGGLSVLADTAGGQLRVHTAGGVRTY